MFTEDEFRVVLTGSCAELRGMERMLKGKPSVSGQPEHDMRHTQLDANERFSKR